MTSLLIFCITKHENTMDERTLDRQLPVGEFGAGHIMPDAPLNS